MGKAFLFLLFCFRMAPAVSAHPEATEPLCRRLPFTSAEAQEPQVALDVNNRVFVAYGVKNTLYCSISEDAGNTFLPPREVGRAGVLALGMRRGPRIAVSGKAAVITAVYGKLGHGEDGNLLAWRSVDGGRNWLGPVHINDQPNTVREGLQAVAGGANGLFAATWLDLRSGKNEIYCAISRDGGRTWGENRLVYRSPDGSVCECCHPSVAFGPDDTLYIMWRNNLGGDRDIYLAFSKDGGRTFSPASKMGLGTWPLDACPMDGGALAPSNNEVMTFWQRGGVMFACKLGQAEQPIGNGVQGWATWGPLGFYFVWLRDRPGVLMAKSPLWPHPVRLAQKADDPAVAAAPNGQNPVIAVWRSEDPLQPGIQFAQLAEKEP